MDKNIYDIRKEKELVYILPKYSQQRFELSNNGKIAVAINLFYVDTVDYYCEYINNIPEEIDVYIISSVEEILEKSKRKFAKRKNITEIKKENRGRDISALLVTFANLALQYEYVCFIHDKKEKAQHLQKDVMFWIENLWENTLGSREYICSILHELKENPEVGMIVPPEPLGEYQRIWGNGFWANNYENTCDLAETLNLSSNIEPNKPPITIGTVFWTRTSAIKKLLTYAWKYEDFPDEPMKNDGEINHAIERLLGYVVQDAGFDVVTAMTDCYAAKLYLQQYESCGKLLNLLKKELGIRSKHEADIYTLQKEKMLSFFKRFNQVYLYGVGEFGKALLEKLRVWGIMPVGFVVSNGYKLSNQEFGIDVFELRELDLKNKNLGIIIAVNFENQKVLENTLKESGFYNYIMGYF